jgi:hypothetical protein
MCHSQQHYDDVQVEMSNHWFQIIDHSQTIFLANRAAGNKIHDGADGNAMSGIELLANWYVRRAPK